MFIKLQKEGYDAMNLGGCRPLANDSLLWFKKSLGGEMMPIKNFRGMGVNLRIGKLNHDLKVWFQDNPMYGELENGHCVGIQFSDNALFVKGITGVKSFFIRGRRVNC